MRTTTIVIGDAREVGDGTWVVDQAQIQLPDGGVDVSASGVRASSKQEAERLAETKACEHWMDIVMKRREPTHPKK